MPVPDEAVGLVRDDVARGIGVWLIVDDSVEGGGFRLLEGFERDARHLANLETGTVAVPWGWRGRHDADVMGFQPTGRIIDVRGVTLVQDTEEGVKYSRFVDWVGALAEMGVGLFTRPVLDDPPNAGIRRLLPFNRQIPHAERLAKVVKQQG